MTTLDKSNWVMATEARYRTHEWCNNCQQDTDKVGYFPPEGGNGEWRCIDKDHDKKFSINEERRIKYAGQFGKCSCCGPNIRSLSAALAKCGIDKK